MLPKLSGQNDSRIKLIYAVSGKLDPWYNGSKEDLQQPQKTCDPNEIAVYIRQEMIQYSVLKGTMFLNCLGKMTAESNLYMHIWELAPWYNRSKEDL